MNNELIIKNIISNLIEVMSIATQFSTHAESGVKDLQGSFQYFSGCEFPFFNGVFNNYKNKNPGIQDNLAEITEFFERKNTPFIWWWLHQSELPIEIKSDLDDKGFQFLGEFSGIAAKLDQVNLNFNADNIKIKCVENNEEYNIFLTITCDVFQLSDLIKKDLFDMYHSYGPNGKFIHYLGFYENEPVATLTSYKADKVVGLYNGATLAKAQKNGLCSILVQNAIKEAINLGCEYAVAQLMAPSMAKGLADKLGFKNYCSLFPFLKDPRKTIGTVDSGESH